MASLSRADLRGFDRMAKNSSGCSICVRSTRPLSRMMGMWLVADAGPDPRASSSPVMPGITMSTITTSKCAPDSMSSDAAAPFGASVTRIPQPSSWSRTTRRLVALSSTMRAE